MSISKVKHICNYDIPPWDEVFANQVSFKFATMQFAFEHSIPWCQDLILQMYSMLPGKNKYTIIDVKVWKLLQKDHYPSQPIWHYDLVKSLDNPHPHEHHAVYQCGAQCYTFFDNPEDNFPSVKDGDILTYGRVIHIPTKAGISGPRLFVRVSQNDIAQGVNRLFKPMSIGNVLVV